MPTLFIVQGIDATGAVIREAYSDRWDEVQLTIASLSTRHEVVRIVVDIALPRK